MANFSKEKCSQTIHCLPLQPQDSVSSQSGLSQSVTFNPISLLKDLRKL